MITPSEGTVGVLEKFEVTDVKAGGLSKQSKNKDLFVVGLCLFAPLLNVIMNVKH